MKSTQNTTQSTKNDASKEAALQHNDAPNSEASVNNAASTEQDASKAHDAAQKAPLHRPVRCLSEEVARKIAAGEVIDRPCAIVRELLDNAIDSGATDICCEIVSGGIETVRVSDNGYGMTKDDLEACARPHATSKIESETDLLSLSTLGFRGEALVSIAAVSRLKVTSVQSGGIAYELTVTDCETRSIKPVTRRIGTAVESNSLFENIPARRVFLKKSATESKLCRQTFTEKALAHNDIAFKFIQDGKQKLDFPKNQTLSARFVSALELRENEAFFHEVKTDCTESGGFSFTLVLGDSAVHRSDKKSIYIFINGRRIWEYALTQAIEYGSMGYFPNGTYPVAALYLTVDPKLVDFNIHPAKREVRFRDIAPIHRAVSGAVRAFYKAGAIASLAEEAARTGRYEKDECLFDNEMPFAKADADASNGAEASCGAGSSYNDDASNGAGSPYNDASYNRDISGAAERAMYHTHDAFPRAYASSSLSSYRTSPKNKSIQSVTAPARDSFPKSYGERGFSKLSEPSSLTESAKGAHPNVHTSAQIAVTDAESTAVRYFGTALGVFLLAQKGDSLYLIDQHAAHERILYNRFMNEKPQKQTLLFPYCIETQSESDDEYVKTMQEELQKTGFTMHHAQNGTWEVTSVPTLWNGTEEDLAADLLQKRVLPSELTAHLAATSACRMAVKDGTVLDDETAKTLVMQALTLPDPHCPHGRPVWILISKDELFSLIRRTE